MWSVKKRIMASLYKHTIAKHMKECNFQCQLVGNYSTFKNTNDSVHDLTNCFWDLTIQHGANEDLHKRVHQEVNAKEAPEVASHEEALALNDQDLSK